ncbi:MAG: GNAT family N-acetyltransferase [Cyclobacteriaceae bacterium]|nr:GNAT family N-acetyltransferase [Cyclobacteriaceae bacterium]
MESPHVEIIVFNQKYASDFAQLNFEWLEKYFRIEPYDKEVLSNPQKYILDAGGQIFIALYKGKAVGTVALIKRGARFELSKMAVTEAYQGLHIGKKLMASCIDYARELGTRQIYLDSNTVLTPAISLYRKTGFKEVPVPKDTPYERCNIRMELNL